ncbi:hypothetical protein M8C21_004504 [Ambrosia artemisiifolia]|uniref:FAR1 domain-containing protein n=1 Tax=Ambrosia artemisiifolia TaxID=4212 RepID=A0AAD5CGR0_AMBAR|nr:hypothetical protein M8C21_004504 [Ambrosia artemisiifolia]
MDDPNDGAHGIEFFTEQDLQDVARFLAGGPPPSSEAENGSLESNLRLAPDKGERVVDESEETIGGVFSLEEGSSSADQVNISPISQPAHVEEDGSGWAYWFTSNGTRYSKPIVDESIKPDMKSKFREWQDVVQMNETYAENCGFSTRIGSVKRVKGIVTLRYILCSKSGKPQTKRKFDSLDETSLKIRQSTFQVCDCEASVRAKLCNVTLSWAIYHFEESHNHMLVPLYNRDLTKIGRKLDFATKEFIHRVSLNKVGPSVAHKMQVSLKGGHHNVKGTLVVGGAHDNSEVRAAIHKLVWNVYIKPSTFESRWEKLLDKYGLEDHEWLRDMFNMREMWVPACFREIPMSCLMKTTSRCESSNASFKVNSSWANTLAQLGSTPTVM